MGLQNQLKKTDYSAVRTLVAIDNQVVHRGVVEALKHDGFARCIEANNHITCQQAIDRSSFDLIIVVSEFNGCQMAPLISEMRLGKAKHHPFPVVMMLLVAGEKDYVRNVIDCGPDYILLMPVAPGPILARIEDITVQRKPFITTFEYVGPDRRKDSRPGTEVLPQFEVPNPILVRIKKASDEALQNEINLAKIRLNNLRLERYAVQSRWLGNALERMFGPGDVDVSKLPAFWNRMKKIARDLPALLRFDMNDEIATLLGEMDAGADVLLRDGRNIDRDLLADLLDSCARVAEMIRKLVPPSCFPHPVSH